MKLFQIARSVSIPFMIVVASLTLYFATPAMSQQDVSDGTYWLHEVDGKVVDGSKLRLVVKDGKAWEWWSKNGKFDVFGYISVGEKLLINNGKASFAIESVGENKINGRFVWPKGKNSFVLVRR